jgi:hypothetical protein
MDLVVGCSHARWKRPLPSNSPHGAMDLEERERTHLVDELLGGQTGRPAQVLFLSPSP